MRVVPVDLVRDWRQTPARGTPRAWRPRHRSGGRRVAVSECRLCGSSGPGDELAAAVGTRRRHLVRARHAERALV